MKMSNSRIQIDSEIKRLIGKVTKNQMQGMKTEGTLMAELIFWAIKYSKICRKKDKVTEKIKINKNFNP